MARSKSFPYKKYNKNKRVHCNEIRCPDYLFCYHQSMMDELNKCEKREQEYDNVEFENEHNFIIWFEKGREKE